MPRPVPLAELVEGCLSEALARQGFASADVFAAWPDLAGEPLASHSQPLKLDWPRRGASEGGPPPPATLVLRVESAFALEAQHRAPLLIERVNALYGWACVGRIVLRQGPVRRTPRPAQPPPVDPEVEARAAEAAEGVADEALRGALARLGRAVLSSEPARRAHTKP